MDELFEIPVKYKGKELLFTAKLLGFGYVYKFQVDVNGQEVFFEADDSGDYRAIIDTANLEAAMKIDVELLKAIAASFESILK